MEPKVSKNTDEGPTQLDAMAWVRSVRDVMYEKTKAMSREDFAAYIARTAATVASEGVRAGRVDGTG
jgi:hypothetical protein